MLVIEVERPNFNNKDIGIINFGKLFSSNFIVDTFNWFPNIIFYGDLVYKFRKNVGKTEFSDQFKKIIMRYKRIGYNVDMMRQSACLVVNPITVNNFAVLFNCTPVGRGSDSNIAKYLAGWGWTLVCFFWPIEVQLVVSFCASVSVCC